MMKTKHCLLPITVVVFFAVGCATTRITSDPSGARVESRTDPEGVVHWTGKRTPASLSARSTGPYYRIRWGESEFSEWKQTALSQGGGTLHFTRRVDPGLPQPAPQLSTKPGGGQVRPSAPLVALPGRPAAGPATSPATTTSIPAATVTSPPDGRERWAVVIGISAYADSRIPTLRYAASDARAFHDWAVSPDGGRLAPARVRLLLNEKATAQNIREALFVWLKQALKEDVVIIYFAGHGSPESPDDADNLFLLPYDARYDSVAATAFPMWDVKTALERFIRAESVVVVADACHAGGVGQPYEIARRANRGIKINPIVSGLHGLSDVAKGVCVISASEQGQFSQEGEQWGGGHGVFTYFLLKGLAGEADYSRDSRISLGELTQFLSQEVRRATSNAQSPIVSGRYDPALTVGK